jgi:hypothetical protein
MFNRVNEPIVICAGCNFGRWDPLWLIMHIMTHASFTGRQARIEMAAHLMVLLPWAVYFWGMRFVAAWLLGFAFFSIWCCPAPCLTLFLCDFPFFSRREGLDSGGHAETNPSYRNATCRLSSYLSFFSSYSLSCQHYSLWRSAPGFAPPFCIVSVLSYKAQKVVHQHDEIVACSMS